MFILYERTSIHRAIPIGVTIDVTPRDLFRDLKRYRSKRDEPYYELFLVNKKGSKFICSAHGESHVDAYNTLVKKYYDKRSK